MLFFERLMYVDGMTPINCIVTTRLQGSIDPEALRMALDKVQAKHPLLRVRVAEENGEPWFVFDDATPSIPLSIVERRTPEDWQAETMAEAAIPFDGQAGPLIRVVWIRSNADSDSSSELLLVVHHCICDGGSLMTLVREILLIIDKPDAPLPPYTSYAALEDLVPAEVLGDLHMVRRVRRKAALYKLFLTVMARKAAVRPKAEPYAFYWRADAAKFAAITARCNAELTSPYAALCVAFLQAFRDVQGKRARNKIMCPVSMRRLLPKIKADMMFAFAPTVALSLDTKSFDTHSPAAFWPQARQMKAAIKDGIAQLNVFEELMVSDRLRSSVARIINFLRASRGGHDLAFSNVGRYKVPVAHGSFRVDAITGSTIVLPWKNANTLLMAYFNDELELGFMSDEAFLPQSKARAIQARALTLLEEAMAQPASVTTEAVSR